MSYICKEHIKDWKWFEKETVTSTNDEIKNLLDINPFVILTAIYQTKGRGRLGRVWEQRAGNLYMTYNLKISLSEISKVVCLIGLALAKTIKKISQDKDVKIKWPNDVFVENKKISGILLENLKEDVWLVGIGVNIKEAPQLKNKKEYQATSLKDEGILLDRCEFLHYYFDEFVKVEHQYRQQGFCSLREEWLKLALNYKKEITIKQGNKELTGIFEDIDENGFLILKTLKGKEKIVAGDLFIKKEEENE